MKRGREHIWLSHLLCLPDKWEIFLSLFWRTHMPKNRITCLNQTIELATEKHKYHLGMKDSCNRKTLKTIALRHHFQYPFTFDYSFKLVIWLAVLVLSVLIVIIYLLIVFLLVIFVGLLIVVFVLFIDFGLFVFCLIGILF